MEDSHIKQFCDYMRDTYTDSSTKECGPFSVLDVFGIYLDFCSINKLVPLNSGQLERDLLHRGIFEWPLHGAIDKCDFYF